MTVSLPFEDLAQCYRSIVETTQEGVWMLDRDHDTVFVNARMGEILGHPPDSLLGRPPSDFMDDEGRAILTEHLARRRQGVREAYDAVFVHRDGSRVWVLVSANPLFDSDGGYAGSLALVTDMTERRQAEAEHRRTQEMLARSQRMESVGRLTGGIAHDFNNELTVILGCAESLQDRVEVSESDDLRELVRAAGRAAELTRRLLMFSRRDAARPETIDLARLVTGMEHLLRRTLGEAVRVRTSRPDGPAWVVADAGAVEQALLNLAVNARDAMPGGGYLALEVAEGSAGADALALGAQPGPQWRVRVSDSGTGMTPEVADRALEPFFSTKADGTGLGLALAYATARNAGGHLLIETEPGRGTTIDLGFPRAPAPDAAPTAPPEADRPADAATPPAATVLVVEDQQPVRQVMIRALRRAGYDVLEASDGASALDISAGAEIDLLLTDVVMPGMSGPELAHELVARRPGLPVLFCSGYSDEAVIALDHGDLLQKPFQVRTLLDRVAQALQRAH